MENRIRELIKNGEKINVEFKSAQGGLPKSIYDTICSFLNTNGGEIILGVDDERNIIGLNDGQIKSIKKDLANAINNPQIISPTAYIIPEEIIINDKKILYIKIPQAPQVFKCKNKILLRNNDGDYDISNNQNLIANLFLKKSNNYSENQIFPFLSINDLNQDLIDKVRIMAVNRMKNHPWAAINNEDLLKSASLYRKDFINNQKGYTLACVLLFGKDEIIHNILPHYRTDLIFKPNEARYEDRLIVDTNLIDSYDKIMQFIEKILPSPFYLETDKNIDIRNVIFRELIVNALIHREYSIPQYARVLIEKDQITITNANKPFIYGNIKPNEILPYTKNPNIAKMFKEIGYAEELGSGIRNVIKYSKIYFGQDPIFIDENTFKTSISITKENFFQETINIKGSDHVNKQNAIEKKILDYCKTERSLKEITEFLGYKSRVHFKKKILDPLIKKGNIKLKFPKHSKTPKQKYFTKKDL